MLALSRSGVIVGKPSRTASSAHSSRETIETCRVFAIRQPLGCHGVLASDERSAERAVTANAEPCEVHNVRFTSRRFPPMREKKRGHIADAPAPISVSTLRKRYSVHARYGARSQPRERLPDLAASSAGHGAPQSFSSRAERRGLSCRSAIG